jgi:hypothetical protein
MVCRGLCVRGGGWRGWITCTGPWVEKTNSTCACACAWPLSHGKPCPTIHVRCMLNVPFTTRSMVWCHCSVSVSGVLPLDGACIERQTASCHHVQCAHGRTASQAGQACELFVSHATTDAMPRPHGT